MEVKGRKIRRVDGNDIYLKYYRKIQCHKIRKLCFEYYNNDSVYHLGKELPDNECKAIIRGFDWGSTNEGSDFWDMVYRYIKDRKDIRYEDCIHLLKLI